ncbi:MAG TPA: hypothetical protein VF476_02675 [Chitinophagaceae bacterium]
MKTSLSIGYWVMLILLCLHSGPLLAQEENEEDSIEHEESVIPVIGVIKVKDSLKNSKAKTVEIPKTDFFNSGFIDILNSGQINASARFIRLHVGEPGKFIIPLSIHSGVSSNSFQKQDSEYQPNNVLGTNLINPLSGLVNISIEGVAFLKKKQKLTKAGLLYQFGERMLTGMGTVEEDDPGPGKPHNFLNSFGSFGFYFQTGAWEKANTKNVGIMWLGLRYMGCYTNPDQLRKFMPDIKSNGFYHGYSFAWGVEINNTLNIKIVHYKYIKKPEITNSMPIYQFSFNYTFKK